MFLCKLFAIVLVFASSIFVCADVYIENEELALKTADLYIKSFCFSHSVVSSKTTFELTENSKSGLGSVFKKLNDMGIYRSVDYLDGDHQVFLHRRLLIAFKDKTRCESLLFKDFRYIIFSSAKNDNPKSAQSCPIR